MLRALKAGEWSRTPSGGLEAAGIELREGEYERRLVAGDPEAATELPGGSGLVVLETEVTPELEAEGIARDLVRLVQQARRDPGFDVIHGPPGVGPGHPGPVSCGGVPSPGLASSPR